MGNLVDRMFHGRSGRMENKILMIGLDRTGKTTILNKLKHGEVAPTIRTIGYNVETVAHNGIELTIWDVGGSPEVRRNWGHYFQNVKAVIFVVDCSDRDRIGEARKELWRILTIMAQDYNVHLLVFANKMDLSNAMEASDVGVSLGLGVPSRRNWYIQPTCATTGEGLAEGLDWLALQLKNR